jgi:phage gp29-like protein
MTTLLGPDGRPIDLAAVARAVREPQSARVGHLQREFDAHPARGLTPARLHSVMLAAEAGDLVGQLELADDMEERDAHLYAELGKRRGAITSLSWSVEAPERATPEEESLADQVRDWLDMIEAHANGVRGGMASVIVSMTDAVLKGFSAQELVWDYTSDGSGRKVLVPRATWHPQRWFTASADRRRFLLRSREQTAPTADLPAVMGEELKPLAWLMHVHPARNGYVTRGSLARVLSWPYIFKNYAVRDLAEFLEIYGLPLRLGKYPAGATDQEKLKLLQAVTQIGHNAAGIIPQSMALEFQAAAAGTEVPFAAMWDRLDAAESKAILGQTLTASEGQHGTQALGNVHNEVRMDIRAADAACIASAITQQLIMPLVLLNQAGVNPRRLPRFEFDTGQPEDLALYAAHLPTLANAGLRIPLRWVHEKLRIPQPEPGEAVLSATAAVPPDPAAKPDPKGGPQDDPRVGPDAAPDPAPTAALAALGGAADAAPRDAIDELVAAQLGDWRPLLGPMVLPLLAEIDNALAAGETLEDLAARLPELVERMDSAPLAERLARAAFSARLAGEAGLSLTDDPADDPMTNP